MVFEFPSEREKGGTERGRGRDVCVCVFVCELKKKKRERGEGREGGRGGKRGGIMLFDFPLCDCNRPALIRCFALGSE